MTEFCLFSQDSVRLETVKKHPSKNPTSGVRKSYNYQSADCFMI